MKIKRNQNHMGYKNEMTSKCKHNKYQCKYIEKKMESNGSGLILF